MEKRYKRLMDAMLGLIIFALPGFLLESYWLVFLVFGFIGAIFVYKGNFSFILTKVLDAPFGLFEKGKLTSCKNYGTHCFYRWELSEKEIFRPEYQRAYERVYTSDYNFQINIKVLLFCCISKIQWQKAYTYKDFMDYNMSKIFSDWTDHIIDEIKVEEYNIPDSFVERKTMLLRQMLTGLGLSVDCCEIKLSRN